jgi:putative Mg2+ transporter-C (MgtC) family protein
MTLFEDSLSAQALSQAADVILKVAIGAVLAGVVGWEREVHGRPAGMRTHILLVIGVVLMCEVSRVFGPQGDPSRIAAQIVTGVGFLGAGAIMRIGVEIKGLTSAASLWTVTGIGMAVSVGGAFLWVALVVTAFSMFTLEALAWFEQRVVARSRPRELLVAATGQQALKSVVASLDGTGVVVRGVQIEQGEPNLQAILVIAGNPELAMRQISGAPGFVSARWVDT